MKLLQAKAGMRLVVKPRDSIPALEFIGDERRALHQGLDGLSHRTPPLRAPSSHLTYPVEPIRQGRIHAGISLSAEETATHGLPQRGHAGPGSPLPGRES